MNLFGTLRAPRELLFGAGQRHALGGIAAKLGQRALIVTDTRLAVDADLLALVGRLEEAGLEVMVDSSTLPDVPVESAIVSAAAARGFAPDLVIGIGGGSCLDMAKCVALLLTHGGAATGLLRRICRAGTRDAIDRHSHHRRHRVGGDARRRAFGCRA